MQTMTIVSSVVVTVGLTMDAEGCHDSALNCPYPTPVCQDDHECGCNDNDDCKGEDVCNTDLNKCEKIPDECQPETEAEDCNADVTGGCDTDKPVYTQCL